MTLLKPSAIRIVPNESPDYKRIAVLVYVFTALALFSCGLPGFFVYGFCILLLWQLRRVLVSGKPAPDIESIILKQDSWLLYSNSRGILEYTKAESLLDNDFFQLIRFSSVDKKFRTWLLFHDQLQPEVLYNLRCRLRNGEKASNF